MRFLISALLLLTASSSYSEVLIENATIPEAPPTARVMTAYMTFNNHFEHPVAIASISSPQFSSIEIHTTVVKDNVARMQSLPTIDIAAGGTTSLEAGGMHLMMFSPKQRLRAGDQVELTLTFCNDSTRTITVPVEKRSVPVDHSHHH